MKHALPDIEVIKQNMQIFATSLTLHYNVAVINLIMLVCVGMSLHFSNVAIIK